MGIEKIGHVSAIFFSSIETASFRHPALANISENDFFWSVFLVLNPLENPWASQIESQIFESDFKLRFSHFFFLFFE